MAQFAVIGLGNFGFNVALALSEAGHQVLAIDLDERKVEHIKDRVTQAVVYDVKEKENLSQLISPDMDAVIISLGKRVEDSTLVTLYIKDMNIHRIIVKATNEEHGKILSLIGATEVIYPEKSEASRLAKRLTSPNLIENIPLAPEYAISEIEAPPSFVGKSLKDLQLRTKYNIGVIAIKEILTDNFYLIPDPEVKIKPDSALLLIGKNSDVERLKM